jgi:hypothetical protein
LPVGNRERLRINARAATRQNAELDLNEKDLRELQETRESRQLGSEP